MVFDVLVDCFILIFGKYKGKFEGKICIKGYIGVGFFEKVFDVG